MTPFSLRSLQSSTLGRSSVAAAAFLAALSLQAVAQRPTLQFAQLGAAVPVIESEAASQRFAALVQVPSAQVPLFVSEAASKPSLDSGETQLLAAAFSPRPMPEPTLPDSPSSVVAGSVSDSVDLETAADPGQFSSPDPKNFPKAADGRPIAPLYTKYIPAGWAYQPIHGREKLILGARDLYSPANFLAMLAASGWSHVNNGQPNYGTDRGAFGQRLGAAAIRQTAQGIFTDGVFAVMFHQDPRYFAEGPKYSLVHRALYAATRPIIVRTTNGTGSTVNSSLLAGYAAAALLNVAYYPASNRNVHDTLASYGGSIGGAALGFVVSEFTDDALQLLHLKHKP